LYRHGAVGVSDDGHCLRHADGTPFLWIGDTVWNGPMRAQEEDWAQYLAGRRSQGFSVIQFFTVQWRALLTDAEGHVAYTQDGTDDRGFDVNPAYFQRMDRRVAEINRNAMVASAIVVLALRDEDAGLTLSADVLIRFATWLRARWGAYHMAWTLGGDGDFRGDRATKWRPIGRAVYSDPPEPLVTMHPNGQTWCAEEFRDESWVTFFTYQSGHAGDEAMTRMLVTGPEVDDWAKQPHRPIINVEPNYEDHPGYVTDIRFTDADVRNASYWSLLVIPTAGVTYGHYSLWAWASERETAGQAIAGQESYWLEPWNTVLDTPGTDSMTVLRRYFSSGPWWTLRPAAEMLANQPGGARLTDFQAVARSESGDWTVVYVPAGGTVQLQAPPPAGTSARWFNPRTGHWKAAEQIGQASFTTPDQNDWLLDLRR
jgi:hypothetical protein